jgi:hypothetical protein
MYKIYKIKQPEGLIFFLHCPSIRVLRQQQERELNPLAHAVCALGRFRLDGVQRPLDLRRRAPGDAQPHTVRFASIERIR